MSLTRYGGWQPDTATSQHRRLGLIADDMEALHNSGALSLGATLLVEALHKWEDLTTMDSTRMEITRLLRAYEQIEGPE